MPNESKSELKHEIFERYTIGLTAILCAGILVVIAILGPLGLGIMEHRTSQSGIYQTTGQDLAGLLLLTPILLIGGVLHLMKRDGSKYFLILTPITLIYTGLSYGIGQEWSNPAYTGNIENYFWLFWAMIVGGLIMGMSSLSMFTDDDAPEFSRRGLRIYVGLLSVFLLFFAFMWSSDVFEVLATGNTSSGSYQSSPTVFWVIRYLDLGISIPVGFISLYLLITRPKKAYPIVLLFFGFFVTLGTAVNTMALVQVLSGDPEIAGAAAAGLIIFPVLGILAWAGLYYLIKDKIRALLSRNKSGE
ncbi:MAG: hypothetical protein JSW61_07290 [Candidatus Thorarchaeota archaeon]|nr:MAG: hypothetical protein JSW61_07290 [Candidatus Thorarchaeota archaeon]